MAVHWRSLTDRDTLGAWDFPKDRTAEILAVTQVILEKTSDRKASKKPIISFKGTEKKLIAGATICKTIEQMYGPDVEQWVGKRITMYAATTRAKGGETVPCVRVRPRVPTARPEAIPASEPDAAMRAAQVAAMGGESVARVREAGED